ncbi:MAG: hypothetical protein H5U07_03865 [Candidatus Aminicenantes bacterium]|nr:hypothetical protein [Candidatus Aminicenantes bacterium]
MPVFLLLIGAVQPGVVPQEKTAVKPENLVGKWELVIEAEGMVINLLMQLELEKDTLIGRMTDQYGTFSDVPLTELKLENETLTFVLTVASPPDGLVRPWTFDLKVSGEEMEGIVYNNEINISVPVQGKKVN